MYSNDNNVLDDASFPWKKVGEQIYVGDLSLYIGEHCYQADAVSNLLKDTCAKFHLNTSEDGSFVMDDDVLLKNIDSIRQAYFINFFNRIYQPIMAKCDKIVFHASNDLSKPSYVLPVYHADNFMFQPSLTGMYVSPFIYIQMKEFFYGNPITTVVLDAYSKDTLQLTRYIDENYFNLTDESLLERYMPMLIESLKDISSLEKILSENNVYRSEAKSINFNGYRYEDKMFKLS